jgi:hypothetical protein
VETPLQAARRERAFQRSRLRVLRRHRMRMIAAGADPAEVDAQLTELERTAADADAAVRALRSAPPER